MDASTEARVNVLLQQGRKNMEDIDACSNAIGAAMKAHSTKIIQWGDTVKELNKKHSEMYEAYVSALIGTNLLQFSYTSTRPTHNVYMLPPT